ncbi:MAG: exodeoxyribonuclease VII large subunit [Lachnospiraceae bacterium]|nr:exodeoxyribonuclease VII large subunit [Lachnospiraceae bacterium]
MEYTVSSLNNYIKNIFTTDAGLNNVYVKGEISNCKYHTSGHIYFTIKDATSQISCVMFSSYRAGLDFRLEEGKSVVVHGNVSVYEKGGNYQIYATSITQDGVGLLYQRFEELKKILELKGYFEAEHKKPIPRYAQKIGIVTAKTGAALQDIINVSKRRNPWIQLVLAPALVQGENAAPDIVRAIKQLEQTDVDVIIVGRGGGSIEDLWAFNERIVATAVYECTKPIISAVGHETDTTIIDYVADMRAPTPSAAAELAVFDYSEYERKIFEYKYRLNNIINGKIKEYVVKLESCKLKLTHLSPQYKIMQLKQQNDEYYNKINLLIKRKLDNTKHNLDIYIEKLNGLSPLSKLKSGFGIIKDSEDKVIKTVDKIKKDDKICVSFVDGDVIATVNNIEKINRE